MGFDNLNQPVLQIGAHRDENLALRFINGNRLASAGRDGEILIWDSEVAQQMGQQMGVLPGHDDYVDSLDLSPDGQSLVSGLGDGTVRIWETFPLARRLDTALTAKRSRPSSARNPTARESVPLLGNHPFQV